jgi:hypothetical protein
VPRRRGHVDRVVLRSGTVDVERNGETVRLHTRGIADVFTDLARAGLRIDTLLEPRPADAAAPLPEAVVCRARREGA